MGGQAGSLLFWNVLLSAFTAAAMSLSKWRQQKELMPYVIIVSGMTQVFFLLVSDLPGGPLHRNLVIPADGNEAESAVASSGHDHPPADALSGLRRLHHPLLLRRMAALMSIR